MAHVEPDGHPVDTLSADLRDALTDVSTELVDAQYTAHGTLKYVDWRSIETDGVECGIVFITVVVPFNRAVGEADAERVLACLGGEGAPVLVRALAPRREGA